MLKLSQPARDACVIATPFAILLLLTLSFIILSFFIPSAHSQQDVTPTRCHAAIRKLVAYRCTAGENECNHLKEALLQRTVQECEVE